MKLEYSLTPYTKINSKWIKDLNVRPDTTKLFKGNVGRTLFDINQSKALFDPQPRVIKIKTKINRWNLIKVKSFCTSKRNQKENEKTTLRMGENICKWRNYKGITSKIYKKLMQFSIKKNNDLIKKWLNDLHRHLSKNIQMVNKHMKRCSASLIIREMQIKTIMRCRLTPIRVAIIKMSTNNKCGKGGIVNSTLLMWM